MFASVDERLIESATNTQARIGASVATRSSGPAFGSHTGALAAEVAESVGGIGARLVESAAGGALRRSQAAPRIAATTNTDRRGSFIRRNLDALLPPSTSAAAATSCDVCRANPRWRSVTAPLARLTGV